MNSQTRSQPYAQIHINPLSGLSLFHSIFFFHHLMRIPPTLLNIDPGSQKSHGTDATSIGFKSMRTPPPKYKLDISLFVSFLPKMHINYVRFK